MTSASDKQTVGDISLPAGWAWQESDRGVTLNTGAAVTATAVYIGSDKGNYVKESVNVSITKSSCDHPEDKQERRGVVDADCENGGNTGNIYCTKCNTVIESGHATEKLGHRYEEEITKELTQDAEGEKTYTCRRCKYSYTETIPKGGEGDKGGSHTGSTWTRGQSVTSDRGTGEMVMDIKTWKPQTPDEKKRYACMGRESVQYTLDKDNAYRIVIENAMQGPLCFDAFESMLAGYTIGRTYNVYTLPNIVYSKEEEIQFTLTIPEAVYKKGRTYKMICVTKNGVPIVYDDLDDDPRTITVRTNKFYAYALIYK